MLLGGLKEPQIEFLSEKLQSGRGSEKNEKNSESSKNVEIRKEPRFEALCEGKKAGSVHKK